MLSKPIVCDVNSNLRLISQKIIDEDVGSVLIKQEEEITGIITEKDLLRAVLKHKDFETTQAGEIMSSPLDCCEAEDSLEKCMEIFKKTNRTRLVVKREGKVVGVMRRKILERFLNTAKRYSLSGITQTPRFRTGRG
jgi:signal-transduction protein with cAMP-binding, CBS, and nucleotidyltransferase domain